MVQFSQEHPPGPLFVIDRGGTLCNTALVFSAFMAPAWILAASSFKASAHPLAMLCRYASIVRAPISPSPYGVVRRKCDGIPEGACHIPAGVLI
jgi:hypothetical protein